ncbi:hypothetical protein QFZ66_001439 [Streptomyces sp. B4I13]|nr:hypothetical protein [Streptomyces sp. B4I13]
MLRTADGGATRRDVSPRGAAGLRFRDVEAFDARRAGGPGGRGGVRRERPVPGGRRGPGRLAGDRRCARVLHSSDRGTTWKAAEVPAGDPGRGVLALAFRDRTHGLARGR